MESLPQSRIKDNAEVAGPSPLQDVWKLIGPSRPESAQPVYLNKIWLIAEATSQTSDAMEDYLLKPLSIFATTEDFLLKTLILMKLTMDLLAASPLPMFPPWFPEVQ